jgi:MFS family permease
MQPATPAGGHAQWSLGYEIIAVLLLAIGFGLVGLDRAIIYPLFPVIAKDLGLNYSELGLISGVLSFTWGLAALFTGHLSDRIGRKKVLIPTVILFSLLVGSSGIAGGIISLLFIRALMGFAEGAYLPASVVATIEASKPSRVGLNVGLMQMATPLIGMGFGPIMAIALLKVVPSWHWIFVIVAVPGLILAVIMAKVLRHDTPHPLTASDKVPLTTILKQGNVIGCSLLMIFLISALTIMGAFMANYMTDHLKLTLPQMGAVLSGLGFGSCVGVVVAPALTDRLGFKPVLVGAMLLDIVGVWLLMNAGPEPLKLFLLLSLIMGLIAGAMAINFGPLVNSSVPPAFAATATGIVIGVGEIVGGLFPPVLAGAFARKSGIEVVPLFVAGSVVLCILVILFGIKSQKKIQAASGGALP